MTRSSRLGDGPECFLCSLVYTSYTKLTFIDFSPAQRVFFTFDFLSQTNMNHVKDDFAEQLNTGYNMHIK